jgi:hypothetical protein
VTTNPSRTRGSRRSRASRAGPGQGGQLGPAGLAQYLQRRRPGPDPASGRLDGGQLAGQAGVVDTGAAAGAGLGREAEEDGGDGGGRGGVADAHLAQDQQVGVQPGHGVAAGLHTGPEPGRVEGRLAGQVAGGLADPDVDHVQGRAHLPGQHAGGGLRPRAGP